MAKVLMVSQTLQSTSTDGAPAAAALHRRLLENLGYDVEHRFISETNGDVFLDGIVAGDYEFCVVPRCLRPLGGIGNGADWIAAMDGSMAITTIALGVSNSWESWLQNICGTDNDDASLANTKALWRSIPNYAHCAGRSVKAGHESVVTTLGTTASGKIHLWKREGTNSTVYFSSENSEGTRSELILLLQDAITAGDIASPPKRIKTFWDMDDIPDSTQSTIGDLTTFYALMTQHNWSFNFGLKTNGPSDGNEWALIDADQKAFVAARTPDNGGLIYPCSHNHSKRWNMADASYNTKTLMDTEYKAEIARAVADGITMGRNADGEDAWGYITTPNNNWSAEATELSSPETNFAASPGNDASQQGYDIKVVRLAPGTVADGFGNPSMSGRYESRGITFIGSVSPFAPTDINLTIDGTTELQKFVNVMDGWLLNQMVKGQAQYAYPGNIMQDHDGGNAPVYNIYVHIGLMADQLKDVHEFSHPSLVFGNIAPSVVT